jgi:hypothetical protein
MPKVICVTKYTVVVDAVFLDANTKADRIILKVYVRLGFKHPAFIFIFHITTSNLNKT